MDGRPTPDVKVSGFECAIWIDYPEQNHNGLGQVNQDFVPPEAPDYCEASDGKSYLYRLDQWD
jgi:hypothetical protein